MTAPRTHPAARALMALASSLALAALIAGIPAALYAVSGSPVPHTLPSGHQVITTVTSRDNGTLFLAAIRALTWIAWACFALSALVEAVARARGRPAPRLPVIAPMQGVAAALIGAAVLSALPFPHGPRPAPPPSRPASATAAAPPPRPGGAPAALTAAMTLPATSRAASALIVHEQPYRAYTVAEGDNLWDLAERFLQDGERWPEIYTLNQGRPQPDGGALTTPGLILPGWTLLIPASGGHHSTTSHPPPPPPQHPGSARPVPTHPAPARPAPHTGNGSRTRRPALHGHQHPAPRQQAVDLPSGAIIGIAVAIMVTAALTMAAIQRRRRYRPHAVPAVSLHPAQPPLPAVIAALRRAARPGPPHPADITGPPGAAAPHTSPDTSADPYFDLYEPAPGPPPVPPGIPASHHIPDPGTAPPSPSPPAGPPEPGTPGTIPLGVRGDSQVAADIAALGGLGLTGPGAASAARALLAGLLAQAPPAQAAMPATIIIPAPDAARLLPGADAAAVPGLSVPASLQAALDEMEALVLSQARTTGVPKAGDDPPGTEAASGPRASLITSCDPGAVPRLRGILAAGRSLGAWAIVLGPWPSGTTCQVAADGTVTAVSPPNTDLDGIRLFHLGAAEAAAITAVLLEASESPPPAPDPPDPGENPAAPAGPPAGTPAGGHRYLPAPAPAPAPDAPPAPPAPATTPSPAPGAAPGARPVRLAVLGPPRITAGGDEISGGMRKARELLTFLAVHPDGASGEAISEALWPEAGTGHAATQRNLALRKARELLRTATGTTGPRWIIHTSGRYHLDPALFSTDLQDFQDALDEARHAASSDGRCRLPHGGRAVPRRTGSRGGMNGPSRTPRPPGAARWTPGPPSPKSSSHATPTRPWPPWNPRSRTTPTTNSCTSGSCGCRPQLATRRPSAGPCACWRPGSPTWVSPRPRRPGRSPRPCSAYRAKGQGLQHPRMREQIRMT